MTKRKLNIDLLKRLRTRFLRMRHPEHFDMGDYACVNECGTAMCIAGHALDLQGYKLKGRGSVIFGEANFVSPVSGRVVSARLAARRELGLSDVMATCLFTDFSIETPKQAAAAIQELINSAETGR